MIIKFTTNRTNRQRKPKVWSKEETNPHTMAHLTKNKLEKTDIRSQKAIDTHLNSEQALINVEQS